MEKFFETVFFSEDRFSDLIPVTAGYHHPMPGHTAEGGRPYYLIHYVEDGYGELSIYGKVYKVKKGQMFFIPRGCDAEYTADKQNPWKYSWISFNGTYAERLSVLKNPVMDIYSLPFSKISEIDKYLDVKEEIALAALYQIFAELLSEQKTHNDYITQTESIIRSSYMAGITVSEISAKIGLDRRYLSRIFSERKGMSIKSYITDVRMQAAKFFLTEGKSVALTAELVGYNDQFNFSKMFKKHFGISPSEMRKTL